jgi:hypothetical protein
MKRILLPIIFVAIAFSSCSVYKSNQTPDDVYYSPGVSNLDESTAPSNNNSEYLSTPNDQYVHMRVQNPDKWSYFDDYNSDYYGAYSPVGSSMYYNYGYGYASPWVGFGYYGPMSFWNSYYSWNSFYNPYYGGIIIVNPKVSSSTAYTQMRTFNPSSYTNAGYYNRKSVRTGTAASSSFSNYSYSQTIRSNYNTGNNASARPMYNRPSSNSAQPNRTYSPSSFGGSSGGGSRSGGGGGGGGISRPHR